MPSQILGLWEFTFESSIVPNMAALRSITFEQSLCEALSGFNLESVSLCVKQKEAISNIVVLNKDTSIILPTSFTSAGHIGHFYSRFKILFAS